MEGLNILNKRRRRKGNEKERREKEENVKESTQSFTFKACKGLSKPPRERLVN